MHPNAPNARCPSLKAQLFKAHGTNKTSVQSKMGQINTVSGRLHAAEAPGSCTLRCCRVRGYEGETRSTWTSNHTKLPIPPPVLPSLLSHQPEGA